MEAFLISISTSVVSKYPPAHDLIGFKPTSSGMVDGAETLFPSPPFATTLAALTLLRSDGASLISEEILWRLFSPMELDRRWNLTLRRDLDMVEECERREEGERGEGKKAGKRG